MKWLLKNFMKKDTFAYILAVIMEISGSLISSIWPVAAAGKIIDVGIMQNNYNEMTRLFILSIIIFLIGRAMSYFGVIIIDSKTFNMNNRLAIAMTKKIMYLDNDYFQNTTVGEMNTLLTKDIRSINRIVAYVIKQFTHETLISIISVIYCITINWVMGLALLSFMPVFLFVTLSYAKKTNKLYKIEREKTSTLNSYIQENIEGNRLIKNIGTEEKEISKFKNLNKDYVNYHLLAENYTYHHLD